MGSCFAGYPGRQLATIVGHEVIPDNNADLLHKSDILKVINCLVPIQSLRTKIINALELGESENAETIGRPWLSKPRLPKPLFTHDCDKCCFLGQYVMTAEKKWKYPYTRYDLYFCEQGVDNLLPTVLARYGHDGPEYTSGVLGSKHPPLIEAERLARVAGLIK